MLYFSFAKVLESRTSKTSKCYNKIEYDPKIDIVVLESFDIFTFINLKQNSIASHDKFTDIMFSFPIC